MGGLSDFLTKIGLGSPVEVAAVAGLKPGRVRIRGTLGADKPLSSPMHRKACAGFHYTCTLRSSTPKGFVRRPLRNVTSWAEGITLHCDDGVASLSPPAGETFTRADHLKLRDHGFDDFRAREDVLELGLAVAVEGKARRDGERWVIQVGRIVKDDPVLNGKTPADNENNVDEEKAEQGAPKPGPPQ